MKARTAFILMILIATIIPVGALGEWLIVSIPDSESDVWMTEIGNVFAYEASVRILHGEIGIHAFIRFEDVGLVKTDKINYATLYAYAGFDQGETLDPGASVTIYGIDEPDCTPFSYSGNVWSLGRPYTSASVNWDLSNWTYGWHSVNVTDIVKEIVNRYAWAENNSLGFQILGASDTGYEVRTFEDIDHQHHGAYAYLYIQFNDAGERPPGLPDTYEWVETYGEYDIWHINGTFSYNLDYIFTEGTASLYDVMYDTIHVVPATPVSIAQTSEEWPTLSGGPRKLIVTSNGILYAIYNRGATLQTYVKKSLDNGTTWMNETLVSIGDGMDSYAQFYPSLAVDSSDNLHAVWSGKATGFTSDNQIWYSNYTTSWCDPIRLSTYAGMYNYDQVTPGIAIDSADYKHVVWGGQATGQSGEDHIWYVNYTTSWCDTIHLSTLAGMDQRAHGRPGIAIDSSDIPHVIWHGQNGSSIMQIYHTKYNLSWSAPVNVCNSTAMEAYSHSYPSIAIDFLDYLYVVWGGKADGHNTSNEIWINNYTTSWGTPTHLSTYAGMNTQAQNYPSIAVYEGDYIHVLWSGKATGYLDEDKIWYANYTTDWASPYVLQPTGRNDAPNLRWSMWPPVTSSDDIYLITDENGTVIPTWNGDNFTDIDDLKDYIDDYVDPEGGDPLDPDPGTQGWDTEGPFTRFKTRLYILFIGLGCLFTPLWAMAYKKFDAPGYAGCFIIMVMGVGLLWSITGI